MSSFFVQLKLYIFLDWPGQTTVGGSFFLVVELLQWLGPGWLLIGG